jgi:hypothetical protein
MRDNISDIRFLLRNEIDIEKWDRCILNATNGLIYARSFYLDTMAENWSALVEGDYNAIMPLTWNRKYGFSYLYQPSFTAQLGLFVSEPGDQKLIELFISHMKKYFRFCEIHLNYANDPSECIRRANYTLHLGKPYAEIRKGYKKRLLENLAESENNEMTYFRSDDFSSTILLFRREYGKRFPHVKAHHYQQFELLCQKMSNLKMAFVNQVQDPAGNLLSSNIFFKDERRIYNIMPVTLKLGREKKSQFFLLDQLFREFSANDLVFDFEGSELPGIAEFYKQFGPGLSSYPFLRYNSLPFPFKLFK